LMAFISALAQPSHAMPDTLYVLLILHSRVRS
jgi:hypothetical protein